MVNIKKSITVKVNNNDVFKMITKSNIVVVMESLS